MDVETQNQGVTDPARDRTDPLVGRLLDGRYHIASRIARGGMASVYEAVDTRLDRIVAVKIMHAGLGDDDDFAARFVREARAAARLSHPHVVSVFDQGDDHGVVFLVMELVPGHTLRDVIRKEAPLAPAKALALIDPVLSALAAAHRAGLIHRDIKPENVLLADEANGGQLKVADFGLAKAISSDTQHTATGGVLIGTVSYLAPELVVDGKADARADVYAAGVVLYELLTGNKPHEGESPIQVAYKHVHEDVPPPSAGVPGIPPYVDALVARATSRDRNNRPADASVLLHQVHRVRQALLDGLADDPDLTADLAPTGAGRRSRAFDYVSPEPDDTVERADRPEPDETVADLPEFEDEHPREQTRDRMPAIPDDVVTEHTATLRPGDSILDFRPPEPAPVSGGLPPARPAAIVTGGRRPSRRGLIIFLLSLLLVIGAGAGVWWFGAGRYTTTPGVLGLVETEAVQKLESEGLKAQLGDPAYSETVPKGHVLATDPEPGSRVLNGGTVTLIVSRGKERYAVPKLKGMNVDDAQDAIREAHLSFGRSIYRYSDHVASGTVLGSDPKPDTMVRRDFTVDIFVSQGPKPVEITDWTGRNADKAQRALEESGLVVERTTEYSDTVPLGRIISQDPSSGTLHAGDTVNLVVSDGSQMVPVPDVLRMGVDDAVKVLEDAGFVADVQGDDEGAWGYVYQTDPPGGTELQRGSTVVVYVI